MRHELSDYEWVAIKPMLPNKPRGVPRVNDRRVLNDVASKSTRPTPFASA
jgi:transposase